MSKSLYIPRQETLDLVKELLATAPPIGAYCLGAACTLAWQQHKEPPAEVLRLVVRMESIQGAVELCQYHGLVTE